MSNKISLTVTAFQEKKKNYCEWLQRSISVALDHPLVEDIVIVNDASNDLDFLQETFQGVPKVSTHQNTINLGVFGNKIESVKQAQSDWVVMCDSDNFMCFDYFDRLESLFPWDTSTLYCPSFGRPQLDYRSFHGKYDMSGFVKLRGRKLFGCLFNTGNQFVHRQSFLDLFGGIRQDRFDLDQPNFFDATDRKNPKWRVVYDAADSAFINSTWLKSGKSLSVVEGLHYVHSCVPGSFTKAPRNKLALHPIYLCEMMDIVSQGHLRKYRFLRHEPYPEGDAKLVYSVDDHLILKVWEENHANMEYTEE